MHDPVITSGQKLYELLSELLPEAKEVIQKLNTGSKTAYADALQLEEMVRQVNAEQQALKAVTTRTAGAQSTSDAAREVLTHATQQAQDVLSQLQQQTAAAESQQQHLQQQTAAADKQQQQLQQQASAAGSQQQHLQQWVSALETQQQQLQQQIAAAESQQLQLQHQQADTDRTTALARLMSQQLRQDIVLLHKATAAADAARDSLAAQVQELASLKEQLSKVSQQAQQVSRNLEVDVGCAQQSFDGQTRSFTTAKREASAECSRLQVIDHHAVHLAMFLFPCMPFSIADCQNPVTNPLHSMASA